jgi:hypothetical protein
MSTTNAEANNRPDDQKVRATSTRTHLPTAVADRVIVATGPGWRLSVNHHTTEGKKRTTTTATTSATATAASPATAAAAATVAAHLVEARVDLLLGLGENLDEITSLLGVCDGVSMAKGEQTRQQTYSRW